MGTRISFTLVYSILTSDNVEYRLDWKVFFTERPAGSSPAGGDAFRVYLLLRLLQEAMHLEFTFSCVSWWRRCITSLPSHASPAGGDAFRAYLLLRLQQEGMHYEFAFSCVSCRRRCITSLPSHASPAGGHALRVYRVRLVRRALESERAWPGTLWRGGAVPWSSPNQGERLQYVNSFTNWSNIA